MLKKKTEREAKSSDYEENYNKSEEVDENVNNLQEKVNKKKKKKKNKHYTLSIVIPSSVVDNAQVSRIKIHKIILPNIKSSRKN